MSDWRSKPKITMREIGKIAAAVFGLMFGIVGLIWLLSRLLR